MVRTAVALPLAVSFCAACVALFGIRHEEPRSGEPVVADGGGRDVPKVSCPRSGEGGVRSDVCAPPNAFSVVARTPRSVERSDAATIASNAARSSRPARIDSLAELGIRLAANDGDLDIDSVLDVVEGSSAGLELVIARYRDTADPSVKGLLGDVLDGIDRSKKVEFALEMIGSDDARERADAYAWLESSDAVSRPHVHERLLSASHVEGDPDALVGLIPVLALPAKGNELSRHGAIDRLGELAFHEDPNVAGRSISALSSLAQDDRTLSIVESHLYGQSEALKIAALNGLYYFHRADESLIRRVEEIARDVGQSEKVRRLADDLATTLQGI